MTARRIFILSSILIYAHVRIVESANILALLPLPLFSHFNSFQPLLEELVKRGHNLTLISGFKLGDGSWSNYTLIDVKPHFHKLKLVYAELKNLNKLEMTRLFSNAGHDYLEEILKLPEIQGLIKSNNKYDLIVAEMHYHDAIFSFGYKFDAPVVAFCTQNLISFYSWILNGPFPSSYVPNSYLPFTEKMSLVSRIVNTVFNFLTVLFYEFIFLPRSQYLVEKYMHFDEGKVPQMRDIMKNISVTLVNSHYSIDYFKPELPNIVPIAGLHIASRKPLHTHIQTFMDEAEHGVIYLSLGSLIEADLLEHLGTMFIRVFEDISQRVIMKWDPKFLSDIPPNVLVEKWISQNEVLNHPNCRLLITHGGKHSLVESLNASVPIIGIPFSADQHSNMAMVEYYEMGTILTIEQIPTTLSSKIDEVLHNPKYKRNVKKRSELFRDRLSSPLDTAMYWIDHVIKYKNTDHLKSAASQLTWYELYLLDVLTVLLTSLLLGIYSVKFIISRIIQKFIYKKNEKNASQNSVSRKLVPKIIKEE